MRRVRWIDTLPRRAAEKLPAPVVEYFNQGARHGVTAAEAVSAWEKLRLRPRVLRDVSQVSTAASVLGFDVDTPVLAAPTTLQRQAHPDGEAAVAWAAGQAGSLTCVSSNSGTLFADVGAQGAPWWVQAYLTRDRKASLEMLRRARDAGARAVVLTVDTPVVGRKFNSGASVWDLVPDGHVGVNLDVRAADAAQVKADDLTFDTIGWLRDELGLPVVVKGVLRGDDARDCVEAGAAAVLVSNHGGRQLDASISTAEALPEIAEALAGADAEVYVDGGLRRGEHILAALALGARAVFVGRPVLWALAVEGEEGVRRLFDDLTDELRHAMTLAGTPTLADLTPDLVR
ncbi:MAG: alpha-hydroxy acid oxidase [Stackebrandtia sp.]